MKADRLIGRKSHREEVRSMDKRYETPTVTDLGEFAVETGIFGVRNYEEVDANKDCWHPFC
jgi:hypothetical protein